MGKTKEYSDMTVAQLVSLCAEKDETISTLNGEKKALTELTDEANKSISSLGDQLQETGKSLEAANKSNSKLQDMLTESEGLINEGKDIINSLQKKTEEQESIIVELNNKVVELSNDNQISGVKFLVTHDGVKYEVRVPVFNHNGKQLKREILKANPVLVKELLEMGSKVLKPIS